MGNYATSAELIARIGTTKAAELTADTGTTPDTTKLEAAIEEAEGEVDGYLAQREETPVTDAGSANLLRGMTLDLAACAVFLLRSEVPANFERKAQLTREWLSKYAEGKVRRPGSTSADMEYDSETRVSGHENMEGL